MSIKEYFLPSRMIAILLIFIVGLFALNEYIYIHKHISKDGTVVIHAHPYNKSHEHSAGDLVFLGSILSFIPAVDFVFSTYLLTSVIQFAEKEPLMHNLFVFLINQERGPPQMI